jgi:hypothetical protein
LLFGPAFCAGLGSGLLLGLSMYRSGISPRRVALIGIIGGPVSIISAVAVLFGAWEQVSAIAFGFTFLEMVWEVTLGIWLTVLGLKGRKRITERAFELKATAQAS